MDSAKLLFGTKLEKAKKSSNDESGRPSGPISAKKFIKKSFKFNAYFVKYW